MVAEATTWTILSGLEPNLAASSQPVGPHLRGAQVSSSSASQRPAVAADRVSLLGECSPFDC